MIDQQQKIKLKKAIEKIDDTPFFIYDLETITQQINKIKTAFRSYSNFRILFAVKANNNIKVIEHIAKMGLGFHSSTLGEIEKVSLYKNYIAFTGPLLKPDALFYIAKNNIATDANSITDLYKIQNLDNIGLRINTEIGWSYHQDHFAGESGSQFGVFPHEISEIDSKIREKICRLHIHTSSDSYKIDIFIDSFKKVLALAAKLPNISVINIGGGMAIPIGTDEKEFNINEYAEKIISEVVDYNHKYGRNLEINIEPGNYLVRPSGFYICRIYSQTLRNKKYYYYSDGTTHHLKGLFVSGRQMIVFKPISKIVQGSVFGSTCQRCDVIIDESNIPKLDDNDYIAIPNTGAYCQVLFNNFELLGLPKEYVL